MRTRFASIINLIIGLSLLLFGGGPLVFAREHPLEPPTYQSQNSEPDDLDRVQFKVSIPDAHEFLSDGQFVYGPNVGDFDVKGFLSTQSGSMMEYAEIIECQAIYWSINPRVLLAIIETLTGLVSKKAVSKSEIDSAINLSLDQDFSSDFRQLSSELNSSFYWHLYVYKQDATNPNNTPKIKFIDGSARIASATNSGSFAIQSILASLSEENEWNELILPESTSSFYQNYARLFPEDDPLSTSNPLTPNVIPPTDLLKLPFASGETWYFYQGPHDWNGTDQSAPRSSIDLGPGSSCTDAIPADRWITAAASGTAYVSCGGCMVRVEHSVDGWQTRYYHVANTIANGTYVEKNGYLGNPSCKPSYGGICDPCGGYATGSHHVHFAVYQNGLYQPINGTSLEGWVVHETGYYAGYLQKNSTTVNEGGTLTSQTGGGTPSGYEYCADEGQRCEFSGTASIAYGANSSYYYGNFSNGVDCNNNVFGDPIFGVAKKCYIRGGGPPGYTFCANENERCNFSGTADVAYGASLKYNYQYGVAGGIDCNNGIFGDPIFGTPKACYYKIVSQSCNPNADQVAYYLDANYLGQCVVKGKGNYPNPGSIGLPNDNISSIKVGSNVLAVLCRDDNYQSTCEAFSGDDSNLSDNGIGNDQVSSTWVDGRASPWRVLLYPDPGFSGSGCGFQGVGSGDTCSGFNDTASSIRVFPGWSSRVWVDSGFNGTSRCFSASDENFNNNTFENGSALDNQISSLASYNQSSCPNPEPSTPSLVSPPNGANLPSITDITLDWNSSGGATEYYAHLWGGPSVDINSGWISSTDWHIGTLWPGTYQWQVRARNAAGESGWSGSWSFTIQQPCYSLTTNVNPAGSGTINANPVPNCNGAQYISGTVVQLTANPNSGYIFSSWSGDASGSSNPVSVIVNGNKSVTANFFTAPLPFNKISPTNGATSVDINPTLDWGDSSGANYYEYCYDTTNDNACSNWTSTGTTSSVNISGLSYNTAYYWHVRATNGGGTIYSNESLAAFWNFSTQAAPNVICLPVIIR